MKCNHDNLIVMNTILSFIHRFISIRYIKNSVLFLTTIQSLQSGYIMQLIIIKFNGFERHMLMWQVRVERRTAVPCVQYI